MAIVFFSTADPNHNITPPQGALAQSGWQYQGVWGSFLGTTIGPQFFMTGAHLGGNVGAVFIFRGVEYQTTAVFDDPNSDLRIYKVCGEFPEFAPLYAQLDEIGKSFVVFGRGTQRGEAVEQNLALKGWHWGPADGIQRWGENVVQSFLPEGSVIGEGLPRLGNLLKAVFDRNEGINEAHLSSGDSGGGLFIREGTVWKLAGINYGVDGPYNTTDTGAGFYAAIFDEGGLYKGGEAKWSFSPDLPLDLPGGFYATRVSSNLAWITQILNEDRSTPELSLEKASSVQGPYAEDGSALIDQQERSVTVMPNGQLQFFRLRGCQSFRITSIRNAGQFLVLRYE